MKDDIEKLRDKISSLEKRANTLEKKFKRITEIEENYATLTTAIMREGIPLKIFSRLILVDNGFEIFGQHPFILYDKERREIERSVDIYGFKDSIYTVPDDGGTLLLEKMTKLSHEVHVVNYEHLSSFLKLVDNPPRIGRISPKQI